jgi:hypothetical protein
MLQVRVRPEASLISITAPFASEAGAANAIAAILAVDVVSDML